MQYFLWGGGAFCGLELLLTPIDKFSGRICFSISIPWECCIASQFIPSCWIALAALLYICLFLAFWEAEPYAWNNLFTWIHQLKQSYIFLFPFFSNTSSRMPFYRLDDNVISALGSRQFQDLSPLCYLDTAPASILYS